MNKDQIIARQSSLKFVIEYLDLTKMPLGLYETVGITEVITNYVLNGRTEKVNERLQAFDKFMNESAADDIVNRLRFELNNETNG